jgi:hypothetical protein
VGAGAARTPRRKAKVGCDSGPPSKEENVMSLFEEGGLDPDIDRNDFTKEDAVKVFEEAIEKLQSGSETAETVEKILDGAFDVLKIISMFA